jgi:predicted nucleic acid-binding protein
LPFLQNFYPKRLNRLLSDLEDGSSVFIDANIFIYHFSKESKLGPASSKFLERIEEGKSNGFTSVAIIQEVVHRMMIVEAASILPEIKVKDLVRYLKAHPDTIKKLVNHQSIPAKIGLFNLNVISPNIEALERSQQMKGRYGFLSHDALTLQIIEDLKINNLASNDSDFERVNFITLYKPSVIPMP